MRGLLVALISPRFVQGMIDRHRAPTIDNPAEELDACQWFFPLQVVKNIITKNPCVGSVCP
jgi:hypothetical protein